MEAENLCLKESLADDVLRAKEVVEGILKAKKLMRMYPSNNPMYINASREIFEKFRNCFHTRNSITFKVTMNALFYGEEQVYHKPEKEDNLAFFFFKDGLREITFFKGIDQRELEEFIKILNIDFENDAPDDDIVTILWDKDLKNIKYFVDQDFLGNWEVACESRISGESVSSAYQDALKQEAVSKGIQIRINESDIRYVQDEIHKQKQPKLEKVVSIISELLHQSEAQAYMQDVASIIKEILDYCIANADFRNAARVMNMVQNVMSCGTFCREDIRCLQTVYDEINSQTCLRAMGSVLDDVSKIENDSFIAYIAHLDERAIFPLIDLLGEMQKIKSRHLLIDALVLLGQRSIKEVSRGLNDSRWYVVRNVVYVLGKIASPDSREPLIKALSHSDNRVRKEAVIAIGNFSSSDTVMHLADMLHDSEKSIRTTTARILGSIKTENAKKLLLAELSAKHFTARDFTEKKEFYRVMAGWQDREVKDFLHRTLNKKKFFKRAKNDENRACAAYALGIMKDKDSAALLERAGRARNRMLRELASAALKNMDN